jgi:uncharacterized protein (TIGR00290 family)
MQASALSPLIAVTSQFAPMIPILLSWSSGKDSAWSLHLLKQNPEYEVVGLLTTFNRAADRVAMHGVRRSLVRAQAEAAGIPLWEVDLPWPCSNQDYESAMLATCKKAVEGGIKCIAFGDLFLTDIREYREKQLRNTGLQPIFPVWGISTGELAHEMIASGLRAKLACIDTKQVSADFAGRDFDSQLLSDLPSSIDPCGENGEFHSFVYAGPMFNQPIDVEVGEVVVRDQFVYADLLPAQISAIG